ncbi:MAG: NADP-dependent oxidoreductase [Mycobacterium sp.]
MTQPPSPVDIVNYNDVIRLTQYVPVAAPSAEAIERFIAAWQAHAAGPVPGVLYRELCRQVPEWNQLAAAEIDNPIAAVFIEYLVTEAGTDLDTLPALPPGEVDNYTIVQDLHTVAFRLIKPNAVSPNGTLMFNLFEIDGPPGMEQGFLMDWAPRGRFRLGDDALITAMLHQRMLDQATIKAYNRAEITDAEAYSEGIARFEEAFPRADRKAAAGALPPGAKPPIRSNLGLFAIVATAPPSPRTPGEPMRAVVVDEFGPPSVLTLKTVRRPDPGPSQIRVAVKASAVNPLDVKMRSGEVRAIYPSWFPDVLGYSVSGIIDALGEGVTSLAVGQEVYGINNPIMRHSYAEHVIAPARYFYPKPTSLDFPAAAAAPSIFATAYGALFLRANLQAGQTVLIHGGSGAVGSCAVQLAKLAGARVITTAGTPNVGWVRGLGADVVVDYRTQRFEDLAHDVDLVLDTVGGKTRERSWPLLRPGGTLASLLPPPPDPATAQKYGVQAFMVHGHPDIGAIMPEITQLLESGQLAPPEVAAVFKLAQAADAHEMYEKAAPRGRIVLVT